MFILADGISFPFLIAFGVVVFGPLILTISLIESYVVKYLKHIDIRKIYFAIFIANILSTLAGGIIYIIESFVFQKYGMVTIPDFYHRYVYFALLFILMYLIKSIVVEGGFLSLGKFHRKNNLTRKEVWKLVIIFNVVSYIFMGPLYYYTNRPTFGGVKVVNHPSEITHSGETIYFLNSDSHLCSIKADGSGLEKHLNKPLIDFMISSDQNIFIGWGRSKNLYVSTRTESQAIEIQQTNKRHLCGSIALSKDMRYLSFCESETVGVATVEWHDKIRWSVRIFDLEKKEVINEISVVYQSAYDKDSPYLVWDQNEKYILYFAYRECVGTWDDWQEVNAKWDIRKNEFETIDTLPAEKGVNYHYPGSYCWRGEQEWRRSFLLKDCQNDLTLNIYPYLGSSLTVKKKDEQILHLQYDVGLLELTMGPQEGCFLAETGMIVFQAHGYIYVLDALKKKLALLVEGEYILLPNEKFYLK